MLLFAANNFFYNNLYLVCIELLQIKLNCLIFFIKKLINLSLEKYITNDLMNFWGCM